MPAPDTAAPRLGHSDAVRICSAARRAATRYPGPVGELIARELRAHLDFGHRFDGSTLVARLVEDVLGS